VEDRAGDRRHAPGAATARPAAVREPPGSRPTAVRADEDVQPAEPVEVVETGGVIGEPAQQVGVGARVVGPGPRQTSRHSRSLLHSDGGPLWHKHGRATRERRAGSRAGSSPSRRPRRDVQSREQPDVPPCDRPEPPAARATRGRPSDPRCPPRTQRTCRRPDLRPAGSRHVQAGPPRRANVSIAPLRVRILCDREAPRLQMMCSPGSTSGVAPRSHVRDAPGSTRPASGAPATGARPEVAGEDDAAHQLPAPCFLALLLVPQRKPAAGCTPRRLGATCGAPRGRFAAR